MAFADPVYRMLVAADPVLSDDTVTRTVQQKSWRGVKEDPVDGPRLTHLMDRVGWEARTQFGDDACVNTIHARRLALPPGTPVVITDVRLRNEVEYVTRHGILIRVERPGTTPLLLDDAMPEDAIGGVLNNPTALGDEPYPADLHWFHQQVDELVHQLTVQQTA